VASYCGIGVREEMGLTPFSPCPGGDWLWIPLSESFISFFFILFKKNSKKDCKKK
jgi:hypothetical protein